MRKSAKRTWKDLAKERLKDTRPSIPRGQKFWPISEDEFKNLDQLFRTSTIRNMVISLSHRDEDAKVEMIDAAYWMKGCSSLGASADSRRYYK